MCLSADDHRLLRGRPPERALTWAAAVVGPRARVVSARALHGGTSSALHRLTVDPGAGGDLRRFVLRRFVRADWLAEEPDLAAREAMVLELLDGTAGAPRLVALDATGTLAGAPAVLMTVVPGRIDWDPPKLGPFLQRLAEPLPLIHAVPVPASGWLPPFRPYELGRPLGPPPWSRHPRAWERAAEIYEGPPPRRERRFVHRDYHPGNVLWSRGRVQGVVDWASASVGSPEVDVGHCRANLVEHFSIEVADRFLAAWEALSGRRDYHPYWDISVVVTTPTSYGDPDPAVDEWMARAVAQLA